MWMILERAGTYEMLEDQPFKRGGEGSIHCVLSNSNLVAKLYSEGTLSKTRQEKLSYMASMYSDNLQQLAWPQDVLRDPQGNACGFVMRRFENMQDMADLLDGTGANMVLDWRKRVIVALNLSYLVKEIHAMGQVIGDMNPKNFGVNMSSGFVSAFDTDSFHIYNRETRKWYPCVVLDEHYIAPEMQAKLQQGARVDSFRPEETFSVQTDRFALAILIFQLLFLGVHPFTAARVPSRGSSVVIHRRETNIYQRMCPFFNPAPNVTIPVYSPQLSIVPVETQQMFRRAFLEDERPSAHDWAQALSKLMTQTEKCPNGHYYARYGQSPACPWCEKENQKQKSAQSEAFKTSASRTVDADIKVDQTTAGFQQTPPRPALSEYRLVDRKRWNPIPYNRKKQKEGFYDGSALDRPIPVAGKIRDGLTDRVVQTPRGVLTIPRGVDTCEMLLYQRMPGELVYVLQKLDTPRVFLGIMPLVMALVFSISDADGLIMGLFCGLLAGYGIDLVLSGMWKRYYRKKLK